MSDHAHDSHGALKMGHHHVSTAGQFMKVLVALLILTILTVVVSRFHFGSANMLIAMAIACVKASLVILFFMHVKYDTAINRIMFLSSFLFLSLLFIFTLADRATRKLDNQAHTIRTPVDKAWVHPATERNQ
ncbi:MAG: cytochrome C oxidase subunit IV family protein [Planctomycetes bacterium]|nr:cytochrome C oxidase subunit IV family protein [Planctomycetota bacterium]